MPRPITVQQPQLSVLDWYRQRKARKASAKIKRTRITNVVAAKAYVLLFFAGASCYYTARECGISYSSARNIKNGKRQIPADEIERALRDVDIEAHKKNNANASKLKLNSDDVVTILVLMPVRA